MLALRHAKEPAARHAKEPAARHAKQPALRHAKEPMARRATSPVQGARLVAAAEPASLRQYHWPAGCGQRTAGAQ
jgi:hypothetical protein